MIGGDRPVVDHAEPRPGISDLVRGRGLLYGADYNPEQWTPDVWQEDVRLMREAGVNCATVGVFSWAMLEPEPGRFTLDWLEDVAGLLTDAGIAIDLATPTASPPPWMGRLWPETLSVTADGVRMSSGSRNHYCPTSPVYRERCRIIVGELLDRFAGHSGVAMWHVGNEFGEVCHCDSCADGFRSWLRVRYGDLDRLNAAWGTSFWSQRYADWGEIMPARRAPYLINPTQQLDFRRFASDALLDLYLQQRDLIRARAPRVPITTNFMGFFRHVDYRRWAPHVDVIADDSYPDPLDPSSPADTALSHDLMRSLGQGRGWMLMEQAIGAVNWREHNVPKPRGRIRRDSLQAVARGANGSCFFQWRASAFGSERFHSAMVPHAGPDTQVFRAAAAHGAELARLESILGEQPRARVAMIFDWSSWWAAEERAMPSSRLRVLDQLRAWYRPLWAAGVLVDVRSPHEDLSGYAVVLAPQLFLADESALANLRAYVHNGGQLVLGPFSLVADENGHVRSGRFPVGLTDVVGVSGEEWIPTSPEPVEGPRLVSATLGDGHTRLWAERLRTEGATVVASFAGGELDGLPAITSHVFGEGAATYVGTVPEEAQLAALLLETLRRADVTAPVEHLPEGVEAVLRGPALFLLNHTRHEQTVVLGPSTGSGRVGHVDVAAGDVVVLMEETR